MAGQTVEDNGLSQRLARLIAQRGLQTPALVALEVGRPLAFVAGQLLWVAQPALSLLWPRKEVGRVARLLETPDGWERLVQCLEREKGND